MTLSLSMSYYKILTIVYYFGRLIIITMSWLLFALLIPCTIMNAVSNYDPKLSYYLCVMSAITFSDIDSIQSWTCSDCLKYPLVEVQTFHNALLEILAFSGYSKERDAIIVSFRGSDNTKNWIEDFVFTQVPYTRCTGCRVHEGFFGGYLSIKSQFLGYLKSLTSSHPSAVLYVTGHSLGAALANFAALDLQQSFKNKIVYYTYGQPRVGNIKFSEFFQTVMGEERYRIIHNADIVPHVPPENPLPYMHFGGEIWYDQSMESYKVCATQGEDRDCSNSLPPSKLSASDHSVSQYLQMAK